VCLKASEAGKAIKHFEKCDFTAIADHLAAMQQATAATAPITTTTTPTTRAPLSKLRLCS